MQEKTAEEGPDMGPCTHVPDLALDGVQSEGNSLSPSHTVTHTSTPKCQLASDHSPTENE